MKKSSVPAFRAASVLAPTQVGREYQLTRSAQDKAETTVTTWNKRNRI